MSGTVLHVGKQALRLATQPQEMLDHRKVFLNIRSSDIINLADFSLFKHGENPTAVIFHMQPIALLFAVAVDRQRLVVEGICDHQWDKFLWELVWPVVVRGPGDHRWKAVGANVG